MSAPDLGKPFHPTKPQLKLLAREKANVIICTLKQQGFSLINTAFAGEALAARAPIKAQYRRALFGAAERQAPQKTASSPLLLEAYLRVRMLEQGRFAGLIVKRTYCQKPHKISADAHFIATWDSLDECRGRDPTESEKCTSSAKHCLSTNQSYYFIKFPLGGKSAEKAAIREEKIYAFLYSLHTNLPIPSSAHTLQTPYGTALCIEYIKGQRLENVSKRDKIASIAQLLHCLQIIIVNTNIIPPEKENPYLYGVTTNPINTYYDFEREVTDRINNYHKSSPGLLSSNLQKRILHAVKKLKPIIHSGENTPVFSHRDFFDKNIIIHEKSADAYFFATWDSPDECRGRAPTEQKNKTSSIRYDAISLVDFEHAAVVKNYILGLNFDLANLVVQWYRYPQLCKELVKITRNLYTGDKTIFDHSLTVCLIIQILAKIDPLAQKMTPGGVEENLRLLEKII